MILDTQTPHRWLALSTWVRLPKPTLWHGRHQTSGATRLGWQPPASSLVPPCFFQSFLNSGVMLMISVGVLWEPVMSCLQSRSWKRLLVQLARWDRHHPTALSEMKSTFPGLLSSFDCLVARGSFALINATGKSPCQSSALLSLSASTVPRHPTTLFTTTTPKDHSHGHFGT